jgi:hypothetical protein
MTMITAHNAHRAGAFVATFLLAAVLGGNTAQAGVIVGLMLSPGSTADGGATSTRSGTGSWQLYALDDSNADFGISSYNITMSGTTAINHRSPVTTIMDGNGDLQTAGFNLLRTGTNVNPIQSSQALPGSTPFSITGFGQTASNFVTKSTAIDAGAVVVGPTTSGVWGNYDSHPALTPLATSTGHNWMFIAEGLGSAASVTSAVFTVFSNTSGTSVAATTQIQTLNDGFPLLTIDNVNANDPGMVTRDLSSIYTGPPPNQFRPLGYKSPAGVFSNPTLAHPATLDPITKEFRWNTTGAMLGEYSWHSAYLTNDGDWNPHLDITVRITAVPNRPPCRSLPSQPWLALL